MKFLWWKNGNQSVKIPDKTHTQKIILHVTNATSNVHMTNESIIFSPSKGRQTLCKADRCVERVRLGDYPKI